MNITELEPLVAQWRAWLDRAPAIHERDLDELEGHLRDHVAELEKAGLTTDEAFLVAVKRMGDIDDLAREFAVEHSGRLWKQLLTGEGEVSPKSGGWMPALMFAVAAAVTIQLVRLAAGFPLEEPTWLWRNLSLVVLPFAAAYFAYRRRLDTRRWLIASAPFAVAALTVNLFPYEPGAATEALVALHLPVVLWAAVAYPYLGGAVRSHARRMDFVRFTGEWIIYYVLIALGGGVLMGLTGLILEPLGTDVAEAVIEWVLPSGAAGAVVIAAWLVESKQRVVENMAPVLTTIFTPLFAVMLTVAAVTYALSGAASSFDRELLGVFDALMVVVLGLVLYGMSAREPSQRAGLMDGIRTVAVAGALVLDLLVLAAMVARIGDLGFTPNRTAALGLNLVLLVNLAGTAWLSLGFLRGRITFHVIERWQMSYLPAFPLWAAVVSALFPPLFAFA